MSLQMLMCALLGGLEGLEFLNCIWMLKYAGEGGMGGFSRIFGLCNRYV